MVRVYIVLEACPMLSGVYSLKISDFLFRVQDIWHHDTQNVLQISGGSLGEFTKEEDIWHHDTQNVLQISGSSLGEFTKEEARQRFLENEIHKTSLKMTEVWGGGTGEGGAR